MMMNLSPSMVYGSNQQLVKEFLGEATVKRKRHGMKDLFYSYSIPVTIVFIFICVFTSLLAKQLSENRIDTNEETRVVANIREARVL